MFNFLAVALANAADRHDDDQLTIKLTHQLVRQVDYWRAIAIERGRTMDDVQKDVELIFQELLSKENYARNIAKMHDLDAKFKQIDQTVRSALINLSSRLKLAQTAEEAAKKRLGDLERQTASSLKAMSTSLENALASRRLAERQIVELQQAMELSACESAKQLASLKTSMNVQLCDAKLQSQQLEARLEASKMAEQTLQDRIAELERKLATSKQTEVEANQKIAELEDKLKAFDLLQECEIVIQQKVFEDRPDNAANNCQQASLSILSACCCGETENVADILRKSACLGINLLEIQDEEGNRPLMLASKFGHEDTVRLLLQSGAEVEPQNHRGQNALLIAAESGHLRTVKVLLNHGANIDAQNSKTGFSAVMEAAVRGDVAMVNLLLKRNASISIAVPGIAASAPTADANNNNAMNYTTAMLNDLSLISSHCHNQSNTTIRGAAYQRRRSLSKDSGLVMLNLLELARRHGRGEIVQLLRNRGIRS